MHPVRGRYCKPYAVNCELWSNFLLKLSAFSGQRSAVSYQELEELTVNG